jgi:predicted GNAT family acetyltransferase
MPLLPKAPPKASPMYKPNLVKVAAPATCPVQQKTNANVQAKPAGSFRLETRPAPRVYRPNLVKVAAPATCPVQQKTNANVQAKPAGSFRLETRPAPQVYKPQQQTTPLQTKAPIQQQSRYELSSPVWISNGRQQIRVKVKGSPTPIGSVDLHYNQGGKAFISDLEVAQGHRRHGVGTMLMKAAIDSARRNGSTATELEANPGPGSISKQSLVGMYQKLGFRNAGVTQRGNPKMSTSSAQAKLMPAPSCLQMAKSYGKHGQLPGRLSRLEGASREAASKALHKWKEGKGMKGDLVTKKDEAKDMEWSIVLALIGRYGRELYSAGFTKQELQRARFDLMSSEEQEWFLLPEAVGPVVPAKKVWSGDPNSIRSMAKRLHMSRRNVRALLNQMNDNSAPAWADVPVSQQEIGSFSGEKFVPSGSAV